MFLADVAVTPSGGLDLGVIIALVVSILTAIFASITAPLILAHRTERMHREDRLADYERQDKVARAAEQTATDLIASQKRIADQAAEAAKLLLDANERVARTAQVTNGKLDVIHTLVNSNMTAAMQSEYDATVRELAMMREVMALKEAAGGSPGAEARAAIAATEVKLAELAAALEDRAEAAARVAAGETGGAPDPGVMVTTTTAARHPPDSAG
jgi:hypothetical protein